MNKTVLAEQQKLDGSNNGKDELEGLYKHIGYRKKYDTVQILGTAPSLNQTRWSDKKSEIWVCSPVITKPEAKNYLKRFDLIFEMHPMEYWVTIQDRLNDQNKPIFMQGNYPQIPLSKKFPMDQVLAMVNSDRLKRYFTSTIAYMIALAVLLKYKNIELYGVHMASDEEYGDQRQACESWLAFADARGATVYIPDQSQIWRNPFLYGYEQASNTLIKVRNFKSALVNGLENCKRELEQAKQSYYEQQGGLKVIKRLESTFK